nr:MAG TPA: hypothetical protein [Caudoviricetes sp.]
MSKIKKTSIDDTPPQNRILSEHKIKVLFIVLKTNTILLIQIVYPFLFRLLTGL